MPYNYIAYTLELTNFTSRILVERVYNAKDRCATRKQITGLLMEGGVPGYFGE